VLTPDDIMRGARPQGAVTVFDDDHYYMAPVIAALLARHGAAVTYVTTAGRAGEWSHYTGEQERTQHDLLELGVEIVVGHAVDGFDGESASLVCIYSARQRRHAAATLVLVTSREPQDALYRGLIDPAESRPEQNIRRIGDCRQPALIAHAVYAGHEAARELGQSPGELPLKRDRALI
jgi:dimethylamine/trimethylamine dehydrogenase